MGGVTAKERILLVSGDGRLAVPMFLNEGVSEWQGDVIIEVETATDLTLPTVTVRWGEKGRRS